MARRKHSKPERLRANHRTMPLREIVGVEKQGRTWWTILICMHASPGLPASRRYSKFYPCPHCAKLVAAVKAEETATEPSPMETFRKNLRRKLKGGTF